MFRTPLHAAAFSDSADCLQSLIEHGADTNGLCSNGETAIMMAAKRGHQNVLGKAVVYLP